MAYRRVNGFKYYYELAGPKAASVVVLANGILADTRNWAPQVAILSRTHCVLTFDFQGQGRSESLCEDITVSEQSRHFAALLDVLGIEKAHYIGVSYGGEVGLCWALENPEQVLSLIVSDSVAEVDSYLKSRVKIWLEAAKQGDPEAFFESALPDIFSPEFLKKHPQLIEGIRREFYTLDLASITHLLRLYDQYCLMSQLGKLRCPALLMCGDNDTLKPPSVMWKMAQKIPDAEFLIVPDSGHALHMEQPEAFMTACLEFLAKQEAH